MSWLQEYTAGVRDCIGRVEDETIRASLEGLLTITAAQANEIRSLEMRLRTLSAASLVGPETRRCPGCRSLVPASMIEHLGQCTGCADAEELMEARV